MAPYTQPGRPGTLTPIEEEKLKDFWCATLQVFGVLDEKFHRSAKTNGSIGSDSGYDEGDLEDKYGQHKEYREAIASMTPEAIRQTAWSMIKHDSPDGLLLRFLRARKWNVERALVMMVSTMRWRLKDMHVDDDIMKNGELGALEDSESEDPKVRKTGEGFLKQLRTGKTFMRGLDKEARPLVFVRARGHRPGDQNEESLRRFTVYIIETLRMTLAPPVDTVTFVLDLTGFGISNMVGFASWWQHAINGDQDYSPIRFGIKVVEANYPECLGNIIVHKAPWVAQGLWRVIKGWLDPAIVAKVHFTNNVRDLEEHLSDQQAIDNLSNGKEDWGYTYMELVPGEDDVMKDTAARDKLLEERKEIVLEFEKATLDWIKGDGDVKEVEARREKYATQMRENYWRLDPYVRARTWYDRTGVISEGGKLDFYPTKKTNGVNETNGAFA